MLGAWQGFIDLELWVSTGLQATYCQLLELFGYSRGILHRAAIHTIYEAQQPIVRAQSIGLHTIVGHTSEVQQDSAQTAEAWLREWGLLDIVPIEQRQRAYLALSKCRFGDQVTTEMRRWFLRRIVPAVPRVAIEQYDLGCFHDPKYEFSLALTDITPVQQQPMRLAPEAERWVDSWVEEQGKKGLIRRAGAYEELPIVTALLLVPGTQHGQDYRVVQNLVPLNKRTKVMRYPQQDVRRVKAALGRSRYISQLDLKAGYYNVPVSSAQQHLTAFATTSGTYYWLRMPQGLQNAPAHFQWVMEDVVLSPEAGRQLPACILLDDTTVTGDELWQTLEDSAECLLRLTGAGAMVGLPKCLFGADEAKYMGESWTSGGYFRPPRGKLAALLELDEEQLSALPRAVLYGMIGYWRHYLPDFAARTCRLRALLSQDAAPWTRQHTEELRLAVQVLLADVPIINFDPAQPVVLETANGPRGLGAVFLQQDPADGQWLPVASYSRALDPQEPLHSILRLELVAIQEALRKLAQVSVAAQDLQILVSPHLHALFKAQLHISPDLLWRVCDIQSYCPRLVVQQRGDSRLPDGLDWDPDNTWALADEDEEVATELQDLLRTPAHIPRRGRFKKGSFVHIGFDGGASKATMGTIGFVIADAQGHELVRVGDVLGKGITNNEAEITAAKEALLELARLQDSGLPHLDSPIRVLGDSQFVVRLLLGMYKRPKKPSLYLCSEDIKRLVRQRKWELAYRAVPRQLNTQADDMCRRAEAAGCRVEHRLGDLPQGAPELDVAALYTTVAELARSGSIYTIMAGGLDLVDTQLEPQLESWVLAIWDERLRGVPCGRCQGLDSEEEMVVCDRCEVPHHLHCVDDDTPVGRGPWYCGLCRGVIRLSGFPDVVQDLDLLDYLFRGKLPDDLEVASRVQRLAGTYRARGDELETQVCPYGEQSLARWVPIPPVPMRRTIISETHESVGHVGRYKLQEALLSSWWWPGLRAQAADEVKRCPTCQVDKVGLQRFPRAQIADRPSGPFRGWSVDLAGPFPPDEFGNKYLAVAVDVFSKWVEAEPIRDKRAFTTASWFYVTILARWGRPEFVRVDHGSEWEAEFRRQCKRIAIVVRSGTVGNSGANGQVERIILALKEAIRRYLGRQPTLFWSDVVPFALMALRLTPTTAHGFPPFTIITGAVPVLPSFIPEEPLEAPVGDATPEQEDAFVEALLERIERLRETTAERLSRRDRLTQRALQRRDLRSVAPTTLFLFQAGDLVLQRTKAWHKGSKLAPKATGPYRVIKVRGLMGQRVLIERAEQEALGQKRRGRPPAPRWVHAALLTPWESGYVEPELVYSDDERDGKVDQKLHAAGERPIEPQRMSRRHREG